MRNVLTKLAAAAAVLAGASTSANAYVILTLTDTFNAVSVSCASNAVCGAGFTIANANLVSFSGAVGDFLVGSTQGSANTPGSAGLAAANTSSLAVTRTDSAAINKGLRVEFRAIDFFAPVGTLKSFQGSASDTAGQGLSRATDQVLSAFQTDSSNGTAFTAPLAPDALSTLSCSFFVTTNNSCDAGTKMWADPLSGVAGFSMRSLQQFNIAAGSVINTTSSLTAGLPLPEPMSASLVGIALLGLAFTARRGANKKA